MVRVKIGPKVYERRRTKEPLDCPHCPFFPRGCTELPKFLFGGDEIEDYCNPKEMWYLVDSDRELLVSKD